MQGIIQASWNWPVSRKDMHVYGNEGYIYCDNHQDMRYRLSKSKNEVKYIEAARPSPYDDPFAFLASVIRKKIEIPPFDLSSIENNMLVMEILEAAKISAKKGKKIRLK